jgi:hypothetical protein
LEKLIEQAVAWNYNQETNKRDKALHFIKYTINKNNEAFKL